MPPGCLCRLAATELTLYLLEALRAADRRAVKQIRNSIYAQRKTWDHRRELRKKQIDGQTHIYARTQRFVRRSNTRQTDEDYGDVCQFAYSCYA